MSKDHLKIFDSISVSLPDVLINSSISDDLGLLIIGSDNGEFIISGNTVLESGGHFVNDAVKTIAEQILLQNLDAEIKIIKEFIIQSVKDNIHNFKKHRTGCNEDLIRALHKTSNQGARE